METRKDTWKLGNHEFQSRFILGSGKYSLELNSGSGGAGKSRDCYHGASPCK